VSSIERQLDHWAAGAFREQWIPEVGQKGRILLSRDQNIRCNELEPPLIAMAKVREFVILGGNLEKFELASVQRFCASRHAEDEEAIPYRFDFGISSSRSQISANELGRSA
jgi:hypothetical protein